MNASRAAGPEDYFGELGEWAERQDWPVATHRYGEAPDQLAELRLPVEGERWPLALDPWRRLRFQP